MAELVAKPEEFYAFHPPEEGPRGPYLCPYTLFIGGLFPLTGLEPLFNEASSLGLVLGRPSPIVAIALLRLESFPSLDA